MVLASLSTASAVNAAGLGRLNVLSRLGQPFAAEIDLINVSSDELASLRVNLAPPAAYQAANLRFDPALNTVRFSVERRANGSPYIRAMSPRSVTEPYLDLLVEVNSQEGKLQRAYAALLDLPESAPIVAAAPPPVAVAPAVNAVKGEGTPPRVPQTAAARTQANVARPAAAAAAKPVVPVPAPVRPPTAPAAASNNAVVAPASRPVEPAKSELPKPAPAIPAPEVVEAPKVEPPKPAPVEPASTTEQVPQKPALKPAIQPPPVTQQKGLMDTVKPYLAPVGGAALLAGIGGLWLWGRRRKQTPVQVSAPVAPVAESTTFNKIAPTLGAAATASAPVVTALTSTPRNEPALPEATVASVTDVVDPIDEAKVYIEYGQSEPAEKILREAMNKEPGREEIQLLLLDILSARGDKDGFNQLARRLHKQTGGLGAHWKRAMAMGYALDPTYPLYLPDDATAPSRARNAEPGPDDLNDTTDSSLHGDNLDFDLDKTMVLVNPPVARAAAATKPMPDIDFEFPLAATLAPNDAVAKAAAAPAKDDVGLDINVDFSSMEMKLLDVSVDIAEPAAVAAPTTAASDAHWEEVQQKIELARAYREMGDKEGALDLLREAESEGDAGQQVEVREMRQTLKSA